MSKSRKEQLEELLAETPDDPFVRYGLAMEYASAGQDEEALIRLQELIRLTPDYVPAYMQAGQVLLKLDQPANAKAMWLAGSGVARRQGNSHAADEMQGFAEGID